MIYSCCFSLGGNLDFSEFIQKRYITSTTYPKLQNKNPILIGILTNKDN